jgi:hypothetical protein
VSELTPAQAAARIRTALDELTLALARNDLLAAGVLAGRLDAACAEATRAGIRLDPGERDALADSFQRCGEATERRAQSLKALMLQSGDSRRAAARYGSR